MSYLDDPRVYFAAERTLLAWQRTSIALIGLGFVVERFGLYMRVLAGAAPSPEGHMRASLVFGVLLLVVGALVATLSTWQFRRFLHSLGDAEIPRFHFTWLAPAVNVMLAVAAAGMVAWFVIAG